MITVNLDRLVILILRTSIHFGMLYSTVLILNLFFHEPLYKNIPSIFTLAALVGSFIITLINTDHTDQPVRWE